MRRRAALAFLAGAVAAGTTARVTAADATPLAYGTMATDASGQAFYGVDKGFFKDAGFDVTLTILNNTASLGSAVASGALAIGFGSAIPVAQAHLRGLELRFIAPAAIYTGPPTPNVIMVAKNSPVTSGKDLNGQVVAVNGLGDLTNYEMLAWIEKTGGDLKTIRVIEIPFSEMAAAVQSGRVAAITCGEPFATAFASSAKTIGDAAAPVGRRYMITGWFASQSWLAQNVADARRLQSTLFQIAKWANAHHAESAAIIEKYNKVSPEVAATMVRTLYGETKPDPVLVQPVLDLAVKYGGMHPVAAADIIWSPAGA